MILPVGGQPPAGLSATRGLAALSALLISTVILIFNMVRLIMGFTLKEADFGGVVGEDGQVAPE
jgi:hypothetical protein